jgi:phage repressor protein C with HTH and peptisase S24 domain
LDPPSTGEQFLRDRKARIEAGSKPISTEVSMPWGVSAGDAAQPSPIPMAYVDRVTGAQLAAGDGEIVWDFDMVERSHSFRTDWMQAKGLRPERCKVWSVRGDSMEPRYCSGDVVLIDMSDRKPVHGKVYGLVGDDGLRIKQLRRTGSGGWEMYSFNPDQGRYPPEPIVQHADGRESHAIIGRVRWRGGDED